MRYLEHLIGPQRSERPPLALSAAIFSALNVLSFIPPAEHAAIKARTSVTDVSSYINAAIAAVAAAGGGTLVIPNGKYRIASTIGQSGLRNVVFQGEGGLDLTYAGNSGTVIEFVGTGSGNIVNMNDHRGVWWRDLQVVYTSNSFTGTFFNMVTSFSTGCGSGFENVQCYQITNNGHTAAQCYYLRNNVDVTWKNCYVSHATNGWIGLFDADSGETNMIKLYNCTSIALTGAAIVNPKIGWSLYGCNFEPTDANAPSGILSTSSQDVTNLQLHSCVFADAQANGTWISFGSSTVGFGMFGGAILGISGTVTGILFSVGSHASPVIQNVLFSGVTTGINFNAFTASAVVVGNNMVGATTPISGPVNLDSRSIVLANNGHTTTALKNASGGTGVVNAAPMIQVSKTGVNMNSVADTVFDIVLPDGCTRYRIFAMVVDHASTSLVAATTVQYALFTAAAGGGTALIAATPSTISATADATANNLHLMAPGIAASLTQSQLFFRVTTAHGSAATADVTLQIQPLP